MTDRDAQHMREDELREKKDQELIELLNEIRVALSGASVLFAFLLVVPFNARWDETTRSMRSAYVVAFLTTLLAVVLLMAPTAYHRLRWRERNKERMLRVANLSTLAGMSLFAIALTAAAYLVIDSVVNTMYALVVTVLLSAFFLFLWVAVPLKAPYDRWDDHVEVDEMHDRGDEESPHRG